jgi:hypothetical protein
VTGRTQQIAQKYSVQALKGCAVFLLISKNILFAVYYLLYLSLFWTAIGCVVHDTIRQKGERAHSFGAWDEQSEWSRTSGRHSRSMACSGLKEQSLAIHEAQAHCLQNPDRSVWCSRVRVFHWGVPTATLLVLRYGRPSGQSCGPGLLLGTSSGI